MKSKNTREIIPGQMEGVWRKSHELFRRTRYRSTDAACAVACLLVHGRLEAGAIWKMTVFPRDDEAFKKMSALLDEEKINVRKTDACPLLGCSLVITPANGEEVRAFLTVLHRIEPSLNAVDDEDIAIAIGLREKKQVYLQTFFTEKGAKTRKDPLFDANTAVGTVIKYMGLGL